MKFLTTMLVLVLLSVSATAQFSIHGKVTDASTGSSLPGANVVIEETYKGVHTRSDGSFKLEWLAAGDYTLSVSFMGYQTQKVNVTVTHWQETTVDILLEPSAVLSQEVIVKATRADSRTPSSRTNVSKEQLQAANFGQDIPYMLALTPSLITSSDAGAGIGYTSISIRGSDASRINVTINGIPINDSESHGVWWVNMPDIVSSTENIQIQRGVGTSTQGAASFGATISINTNALQEKAYAEINTTGGSFNTLRNTVNLGTGLMENGWSFDGRLSRSNSDGYIDRSFSDLKSFYVSGGYFGKNTAVKAIVFGGKEQTYLAWNGVPGNALDTNRTYNPSGAFIDAQGNRQFYENETDNYQQDHYQLHLTHRFVPGLTGNASLHYTYGRGYYEQFRQRQRFSSYGLPNVVINNQEIPRTDLIRQRWLDNHFYGLTWALNYNNMNRMQTIWGGGYNNYDGSHFGKIIWASISQGVQKGHHYYDNEARKQDFNSFVKVNYELYDGLYIFGDLQYRNIVYDFQGPGMVNEQLSVLDHRAVYHFVNPKAGINYDFSTTGNVYLFLGRSNREPVRKDFTESTPQSRPRPEKLTNLELGYRYNGNNLMAGINYFLMDYRDQLVLTGEINDSGGATRMNIDKSSRMGIEAEVTVRADSWIEAAGNVTLSRNKIPTFTEHSDVFDAYWTPLERLVVTYTNTDIAFSPSIISAARVTITPPELKDASVSLLGKYVSRQYIDNTMNEDRMLNAYLVNDLRLAYVFRNGMFRELELSLAVNNIFNVDYITNAWIYKGVLGDSGLIPLEDGYFPQAGRHFLAGLRLRL
jgi:iron complex outermembrane recepter protein